MPSMPHAKNYYNRVLKCNDLQMHVVFDEPRMYPSVHEQYSKPFSFTLQI